MAESHFAPLITDDYVKMHEDYFVPAIYAQWAHHVTELAAIESGHEVLDVACGTGILARTALLEVGMRGKVTGLDHNEKMLAKARQLGPAIHWQVGDAAALPFEASSFDRVLCQFALMFIKNRVAAIKELLRVCKPDGMIVVATWAQLEHSPAYRAFIELTRRIIGSKVALKLREPWALGSPGRMDSLLLSSGVNEFECHERPGVARFPSVDAFVETHLRTTGEFHSISEQSLRDLLHAVEDVFQRYVTADGRIIVPLDADIYLISPD
jgi:SAM-dependent methyltransferase